MDTLVVYSMSPAISYIGERVSEDESRLVLKRVLVLIQGRGKGDAEMVSIGNVPFASRDSLVTIDKKAAPGIMIENIDTDLQDHYGKEIISAYSKLKLA